MPDALTPYDPIFQAAGDAWNIQPLLLRAIAMQESRGNPRAISNAGALGLMQIGKDTWRGLGVEDPFNPVQSIWAGAKYLSQALNAEDNDVNRALLYYHGGPGWRQAYGPESKAYVPAVGAYYQAYLAQQERDAAAAQPPPPPTPAPPQATVQR